jgi:phage tail sheath protein FI
VVDRRNASEWLQPAAYVEELPHRPAPIRADDRMWKYVNVRRLPAYVEQSIGHGLQWVVFEPNDERLWARVREQVDDFLTTLWRDGRLVGTKAQEAFFVRCDRSTMTQNDLDNGRLVVLIGIAPLRPAEFVIFRIGQWAVGSDDPDD